MRPPHSLADAQQALREIVTAPEGVAAALRAAGDPDGHGLAALLRGDGGLPPAKRLEIYANAYFERLRAALATDFPDLARALGDDAFHDLVRVYLMIHPPQRPSIRDAGARLAGFLASDEVAGPFRRHLPCVADLAAFEWAQTEAFDAPDARPLSGETLAALGPEAWPELRLAPVPALRLLSLDHPVHVLGDDATHASAATLAPRPTRLCVWRHEERVRFRELSVAEHGALVAVRAGGRFAEVCEVVGVAVGEEAAPSEVAGYLARWIGDGCLRAPEDGPA